MNTKSHLAILLTAAFVLMSCEKENPNDIHAVVGIGEIVTLPLELDPFDQIELQGVANLYVSVGDEQSMEVKAQQNIMDVLTWEVKFATLIIGIDPGTYLENHEGIRFDIALPDLNRVVHHGVGDIRLEGGNKDVFYLEYRGVGDVDAYAFPVDHCVAISSGVGHCMVQVNEVLEVDISGIGNVYYRGYPKITSVDNGLGDLINAN